MSTTTVSTQAINNLVDDPDPTRMLAMEESSDDEPDEVRERKRPKTQRKKQKWSQEEEDELRQLFGNYLDTKSTPGLKECAKLKAQSRKNGGVLHLRASPLIIKKISAKNHSKKKS